MRHQGIRLARFLVVGLLVTGCGGLLPPPFDALGRTAGPGLARDEAIGAAKAAAPQFANAEVLAAELGSVGDFVPKRVFERLSPVPLLDDAAWRIRLGEQPSPTGGGGVEVIINARDGRVILVSRWTS